MCLLFCDSIVVVSTIPTLSDKNTHVMRICSPSSSQEQSILWVTDTHLDTSNIATLIDAFKKKAPHAIFITGDIANGNVVNILDLICQQINIPIYFVLGNSDHAYSTQITHVRQDLEKLSQKRGNLHYARTAPIMIQSERHHKTALVGFDGYANSWSVDPELKQNDGNMCQKTIEDAIAQGAKRIIILTHVPPFITDCWYKGKPSTLKQAQHYMSSQSGEIFSKLAKMHPDVTFIVYCGHTHNRSYNAYPLNDPSPKNLSATGNNQRNLLVYVGNKFKNVTSGCYSIQTKTFKPTVFE